MAQKISESIRKFKNSPMVDSFVIQKFLEEGNTPQLRRSVSLKNFIRQVHAVALTDEFKRVHASSTSHELTDMFFAAVHAMRLFKEIPNTWQIHLLKLIKGCGYDDEDVVRIVKEFYKDLDRKSQEHMNIAARQLGFGTIFRFPKMSR